MYTKIKDKHMTAFEDIEMGECPICIETMLKSKHINLVCNHKFHTKCIVNWFKEQVTCPLCRSCETDKTEYADLIELEIEIPTLFSKLKKIFQAFYFYSMLSFLYVIISGSIIGLIWYFMELTYT
jgi:hypothetical protein